MSRCPNGPVHVSGGFLLLSAWFALESGLKPLALILFAAILHELGHFVVLRLCGAPVQGVRLGALGAVMKSERSGLSYGTELLALLAGPLTNLLCAAALTVPARILPGLYAAAGTHLALGAFNLLPIRPLDGGQALELLVTWHFGPAAGEQTARLVGFVCAALLCVGLVWLMYESRGNLWLAPPAAGLLAVCLRELQGVTRGVHPSRRPLFSGKSRGF